MKILTGLFDQMVLQRNAANCCEVVVHGEASNGRLLFRAGKEGGKWQKAGVVADGHFQFLLEGLPVGGPYKIDLQVRVGSRIVDRLVVKDVLVGDVWICGGQSNMQGCGRLITAVPHRNVRAFYMDDSWAVAKDPIHNLWACVDEVYMNEGMRMARWNDKITGPGVAFAKEMLRRTQVPQGLIACAQGGASMAQWDPALKNEGSRSLYGATVRRLQKIGGRVAGVIWYQGESEANPACEQMYSEKMCHLIQALRRDAKSPRLPFAIVQLARVMLDGFSPAAWNSVQDQQRLLATSVTNLAVVPAIDLELDDGIHVSALNHEILGERLAQAMRSLAKHEKAKLPISLESVKVIRNKVNGCMDVHIRFNHVEGKLCSRGLPAGFKIVKERQPLSRIFKVDLNRNMAVLHTSFLSHEMKGLELHYGHGLDPHCNIHDMAGRSLPVFGPIVLPYREATPFVRKFRMAGPVRGDWRLKTVRLPAQLNAFKWKTLELETDFCDLRKIFATSELKERFILLHCQLDAPHKIKMHALLGYDGPTKLWINRRLIFHDDDGNCPAFTDKTVVPFTAKRGRNDILVAFSPRTIHSWGITLRFESAELLRNRIRNARIPLPKIQN